MCNKQTSMKLSFQMSPYQLMLLYRSELLFHYQFQTCIILIDCSRYDVESFHVHSYFNNSNLFILIFLFTKMNSIRNRICSKMTIHGNTATCNIHMADDSDYYLWPQPTTRYWLSLRVSYLGQQSPSWWWIAVTVSFV